MEPLFQAGAAKGMKAVEERERLGEHFCADLYIFPKGSILKTAIII